MDSTELSKSRGDDTGQKMSINIDEIEKGIEKLAKEDQRSYIKSKDVARKLDRNVSNGNMSRIGELINRDLEGEQVELWNRGSTSCTWRVKL